ncbi:MAG: AbrB/MazE/SpoVT family DNA-binding domain-containing protein [Nanoarchaeota archaeon]
MVELTVKLGPKGQILIPKILREHYKIFPNQEAIIKDKEEGILITRSQKDPIEIIEKIVEEATKNRKNKKVSVNAHAIYEQYEKRAKRAGL